MILTQLKKNKQIVYVFIFIFLIATFVFLRLYNIKNSIEFWGDIGRDHEKLMEWLQTGKPPLLGPNTSVLPILNQSAWFYYLIFPVFLLTHSGLSMTYTVTILTVFLFIISMIIQLKKHRGIVMMVFLLISIHPLIVIQQRTPWNPSFSIPFLLVAISGIIRLSYSYSNKILLIVLMALSFSLGMTYSLFPIVVILGMWSYLSVPKGKKKQFILYAGLSFLLVFAPTLIFELKPHYFIEHFSVSLLTGSSSFFERLIKVQSYLLLGQDVQNISTILKSILIGCFYGSIFIANKSNLVFKRIFIIAIIGTLLTALLPFDNSHYFFGVIVLWFFVFSLTNKPTKIILLSSFVLFWVNPFWVSQYTKSSIRALSIVEECAKTVCTYNKNSYFVSSVTWYGSHSAHDHAFLLNKYGCFSRDIVSNPTFKSNQMIVVADRATFTPYKDSFYELEQFGKYRVKTNYYCSSGLQYWLLTK